MKVIRKKKTLALKGIVDSFVMIVILRAIMMALNIKKISKVAVILVKILCGVR